MAASCIPVVTDIHPQSFVGGFQFNNGRSYRIFYQDKAGLIHVCTTDNWGGKWSYGDSQKLTAPGAVIVPTPIASCIYTDAKGANSRTFWITKDHKIYTFAVGGTSGMIGDWVTAAYSRLGVISWVNNGVGHMRLYFQTPDDHVQELCWDGKGNFTAGHRFPCPKKGTALSFINLAPKASAPIIRGYYQHTNNHILEIRWEAGKGWHAGSLNVGPIHSEGYDTAHISACASTAGVIAQYWAVASNSNGCHLTYERWEEKGHCKSPEHGRCIVPCFSKGNPHFLATCHVPEKSDQTRVRLFFVGCNGRLCEARRENEHWGWGGKECGNIQWSKC